MSSIWIYSLFSKQSDKLTCIALLLPETIETTTTLTKIIILLPCYFSRRLSGRLAARAMAECKNENARRKLDYGNEGKKTPKVNGSILKHKRTVRIY